MKRFFSIILILLYLYSFAGYLVMFTLTKGEIQQQVREHLKRNIHDSERTLLAFHTASFQKGLYAIAWNEADEFRYAGRMYDVVRSYTAGDSTYYVCFEDTQEDQLIASFDENVQRHIGGPGSQGNDSFKDVFKDSLPHGASSCSLFCAIGTLALSDPNEYNSVTRDVAFPPPRSNSPQTYL